MGSICFWMWTHTWNYSPLEAESTKILEHIETLLSVYICLCDDVIVWIIMMWTGQGALDCESRCAAKFMKVRAHSVTHCFFSPTVQILQPTTLIVFHLSTGEYSPMHKYNTLNVLNTCWTFLLAVYSVCFLGKTHLPSISYSPYISGNRLNTCSCHSCRHPNTSGRQKFPEKEKQQHERELETASHPSSRQICDNMQKVNVGQLTSMHGLMSWFRTFRAFFSIWICVQMDNMNRFSFFLKVTCV